MRAGVLVEINQFGGGLDGAEGGLLHARGCACKGEHGAVVVEEERSSSFTSLTDWMAAAIWSITSGRRASEKLGIHSINVVMWSRSLIVWWSGGRVAPNGIRGRTETRLVKAIITTVR